MFVALETDEPRFSGIFGDILNIITKRKPRLEPVKAKGAAYGVISVVKPVRASDWRRVAALAGRYADRMLLPEGVSPPPPMKALSCPRFERRVLLETAIEIIRLTRMPMYRRVAGLVDASGRYADFLFPMLHHYTAVKVLTDKTSVYLARAQEMMEELGAPVVLCEDPSALSDCVLIVAPDGIETVEKPVCPVLAFEPPDNCRYGDFITNLRIEPDNQTKSLCPKGIEPHRFTAALYEYCGVEPAMLSAGSMVWRYRTADIREVARAVSDNIL